MSGRQLAAALVVIALLAFVLPPVAAHRVNHARITRAHEDAQRIAEAVDASRGTAQASGPVLPQSAPGVLAGSGEEPKYADHDQWPVRRAATPVAVSPDPWGNQYVVVVSALPGDGVAVLSAGPNGIVETSFKTAVRGLRDSATPAGDDIVVTSKRAAAR